MLSQSLTVLAISSMVRQSRCTTRITCINAVRKARGDANPILLIDEDDVTAGHAKICWSSRSITALLFNEPWYLESRSRAPCYPWIPCASCYAITN